MIAPIDCGDYTPYATKAEAEAKARLFSGSYVGQPKMEAVACSTGLHWHVKRA